MNCIIIEDQLPAQRILKSYIKDIGSIKLKAVFTNAIEAVDFLKHNTVDFMFVDIHLPKLSGIDFLKTLNNPPQVILTTAFSEYAIESYELNVVDYLLKPFSFKRFVQAVNKIKNNSTLVEEIPIKKEIYIKSGHEHIKIKIDELLYIKSDTDYTELYTNDKKYLSSETLKHWETELKTYFFARIHKSYVINTDKIKKIVSHKVYLNNSTKLPIGRSYKDRFLELLNFKNL